MSVIDLLRVSLVNHALARWPGCIRRPVQPVFASPLAIGHGFLPVRSLRGRFAVCFLALLAHAAPEQLRAQPSDPVSVAFLQGKAPVAPDAIATLGPDMFGDKINLYNGSFEIEHTDFSLPGNSALLVALVRQHSPGRSSLVRGAMADWDLHTPRVQGTFAAAEGWVPGFGSAANRCSGFAAPPQLARGGGSSGGGTSAKPKPPIADPSVPGEDDKDKPTGHMLLSAADFPPWEYWQGTHLVIPGQDGGEILTRASGNALAPADGSSYPLVTKSNWQIACLPSIQNGAGQGFLALSPEGVKYRFDWMASRDQTTVRKGDAVLTRRDFFLMATQVSDRFGNWVRYSYDPANPLNLRRIESNDGRVITVNYSNARVSSASDGTRTWQYAYSSQGDLQTVTQPDGSSWQFNLRPLVDPQSMVFDEYRDCDTIATAPGLPAVGTMVHPSGATGTFTTNFFVHGRTNVTRACTVDPASGWTTGSMWAKSFANQALTSKQISGPGMPSMTWTYGGDSNDPNGEWAPCNGCQDRKIVTVTEPSGAVTRHTFGIKWRVNEGQLLRVEEGWDGSSALKTTDYSYRDAAGQAYADRFGDSVYFASDFLATRNRPQQSRVITQQGVNFTLQVDSTPAGFDQFARPAKAQAYSSLGYTRTLKTDYKDNLALWVLGQTERVTEMVTGREIESHTYSSTTALRTASTSFGRLTQSFAYNTDGTLATLYDAAGRPISFQNFMRGKPQRAVFQDNSVATRVVNNLGNVASVTNEVSSTTSYGFDAMGRVSSINYPTGDPVSYLPTQQVFARSSSAELGLPAGHWRQTITTGNAVTVRWFDAMWRVRVERRYDAGNPNGTSSFVETRYDAGGRKVFQSYPSRTFNAVDAPITGKSIGYDALNRVTQELADSELGVLTTSTAYLSGFQRRVTNPRGFANTSSFLVFDSPSEEQISQISAPEGVQLTINRDVFGKPLSITRAGGGVSVTRSYVYDPYQRLCKTLEPEIGATVQQYDTAGNIAWRAAGVNLPSTSSCDQASVPGNAKISHTYYPRNQLWVTSYGDGSPSITRDYWADGLLKTLSTSNGSSWSYAYGTRRLLSQESLSFGGVSYVFTRGYNNLGHLATLNYPAGGPSLSYNPNALGQPQSVGGYASNISFHPNGAVAGYTLGNNIAHTQSQNTRGLPMVNRDAGVMQDRYSYDANGNVAGIADQQENLFSRTMVYDGLERLTSTSAPQVWGLASYGYDAVDNLRSAVVGSRSSTLSYDASNKLSSIVTNGSSTSYLHDARGNTTNKGLQQFTFDIGNRLLSSSLGGGYVYDGHGRRIRVVSSDGSTRMQVYDLAGQLLWATSTGGSRPTSSTAYIHLGNKQIAEWNSVHALQYVHTDALGSPVAHSNAAGALLNRTRYEPYGYVAQGTKPSPSTSVIGFTGHVQDVETDLVYMQQRYYDPIAGRFLSVDPVSTDVGNGALFNRYMYAANNPYRYLDPDGRCTGSRITNSDGTCASTGGFSTSVQGMAQGISRGADGAITGGYGLMASQAAANGEGLKAAGYTLAGTVFGVGNVLTLGTGARIGALLKGVRAGQSGAFGSLRGVAGDGLTAHHMPQAAAGRTSYNEGGALVMTQAEHVATRTYGSRGIGTLQDDAGLSFRDVLARDIRDVRSIVGTKYNEGLRDLADYYRQHFPGLMEK